MSRITRHFDHAQWADFVRNQLPPDQHAEMVDHLQSGCSKCKNTKELLDRFAAVSKNEQAYAIPEGLERSVKAILALDRPEIALFRRILGNSLFDSYNDPLPVGIRA